MQVFIQQRKTFSKLFVARMLPLIALLAVLAAPVAPANAAAPACILTPFSIETGRGPVTSTDGKYVVYTTSVNVPNYGPAPQVFVYNRVNHQSKQASLSYKGETLPDDDSYTSRPAISDDGRIVVFFSRSRGLTPEDSRGTFQLYARDMVNNTIEMVTQNAGVSANDASWTPALSADGRYVAFQTYADNLVPGETNHADDVYVHDRQTGTNERISMASDGSEGYHEDEYGDASLDISADGRYVVFPYNSLKGDDGVTHAGIFLRDRQAEKTYWIASGTYPVMTPDARFIAFFSTEKLSPNDENTQMDLYLYDRTNSSFELISAGPDGKSRTNQAYVRFGYPVISDDGNLVAFTNSDPNLVAGDTNNAVDVFLRDRSKGTTERLSVSQQGEQSNDDSFAPTISADGQYLAFFSMATNLDPKAKERGYNYLCQRTPAAAVTGPTVYLPIISRN